MKPMQKALLLALAQLLIVCSLGAKLLYDRATRPRAWARAAPYDPELPVRGRYVSLQLELPAPNIEAPSTWTVQESRQWRYQRAPVLLAEENGRLVARRETQARPGDAYREDRNAVVFWLGRNNSPMTVLAQPVLYFIPEHAEDPSRRAAGEELWVEVTIPKKGPPRPIRLGVKKGDTPIVPLELN